MNAPFLADWQADYRAASMTAADLLARVGLTPADVAIGDGAGFPVKVPPHFLSLIRPGDPDDPLLRQVLARAEEAGGEGVTDPLQEEGFRQGQGILRKYGSRALLLVAGACAIHCRYCFRRHGDYGAVVMRDLDAALATLAGDSAVREVILSGGDPLSLSDDRLAAVFAGLARLPQLEAIRLHSRTATTVPARVTPMLLRLIESACVPVVMVTHSNHAQELDPVVATALGRLRAAGATLLNQAVLLRGVNDDAQILEAHCRRLFACGVLPYYVHLLDAVAGAAHFAVPLAEARALEQALRDRLPGYLVPRFVREVPGMAAKTPIWQIQVGTRS